MTATGPRLEPEAMLAARLARGGRWAELHARTNPGAHSSRMTKHDISEVSGRPAASHLSEPNH